MQDVTASLVRPVKELKNFCKVELAPGESREVSLLLPKAEMGFYDNNGDYIREDGLFRIFIGGNSVDVLMQEMEIRF